MHISKIFFFFLNSLLLSSLFTQGFQSLSPLSSDADNHFDGSLSPDSSPPSQPPLIARSHHASPAPAPSPISENDRDESPATAPAMDAGAGIRWCAVRDQLEECRSFLSVINQLSDYTWKCVQREKAEDCMESIKKGEADLVNLEAGLAYNAFINHSMKAIANEMYYDHSKTYEAVAVVNRRACERNEKISLMDFKGHKSCHGGYSTAAGWNYPINYIKNLTNNEELNDREIATSFFSGICAPSEIDGFDICNACSKENETCPENGLYSGHSGAFRCLVEEFGDIAFVKGDTVLLYSMEGPLSQLWSTKSVRDFMYLCPQGGCKEINGYPGECSFGAVPANVIMAHNSMPNTKREHILETLTNPSLMDDALYAPNNIRSNLFSPTTQGLALIEKVTRLYLGKSASISQSVQKLNATGTRATSYEAEYGSGTPLTGESSSSSHTCCSQVMTMFSLLMLPLILGILTPK